MSPEDRVRLLRTSPEARLEVISRFLELGYSEAVARSLVEKWFGGASKSPAPKPAMCECGVAKVGGLHSDWCPLTSGGK